MVAINRFEINGVIDTSDSVLKNMLELADNCLTFVSWNPTRGVWEVKVNGPSEGPYRQLGDDDIVGSINVTGSGVDEIYNSVAVSFRNRDLNGNPDEVITQIAASERYEKELDNRMNLSYRLVNNSVQAEYLGNIELKQSRLDTIVEFALDWRHINIEAGEIVAITNNQYGWDEKLFRIITVDENDDDDGAILLKITALEHDNDVYDDSGLQFYERPYWPDIIPKNTNTFIDTNESEARGEDIADALNTDTGRAAITGAGIPILETETYGVSLAVVTDVFAGGSSQPSQPAVQQLFSLETSVKVLQIAIEGAQGELTYTVDGVQKTITAGVPSRVKLFTGPSESGPWSLLQERFMEWSTYVTSLNIANQPAQSYRILIEPLNTFDLNAATPFVTIDSVDNFIVNQATGDAASITVSVFLN